MKQELFFGKLLPSHPLILPILVDIREKYQIPEISPTDDGFKILLEHELEIDWKAVQEEILTRVKDIPDFLPKIMPEIFPLLIQSDDTEISVANSDKNFTC